MKDDWVYFCRRETKTGLMIGYNTETGLFRVVTTCCPGAGIKIDVGRFMCGNCGFNFYSVAKNAIDRWAVEWNIKDNTGSRPDGDVIGEWITGWTDIPEEDLQIVAKR